MLGGDGTEEGQEAELGGGVLLSSSPGVRWAAESGLETVTESFHCSIEVGEGHKDSP